MTLYEIGCEYEKAAIPLRARLRELRQQLKASGDPDERFNIKRRIAELTPMLTDCNKLARYCKGYYEKGYFINNGAFERYERPGERAVKQAAATDHPTHFEKRVDTGATTGGDGMSFKRENIRKLSGRTRRCEIDCFKNILQGVD